ncbi:hypothetical protein BGZ76_004434, partial [Entomortierella beljakovae]
MSSTETIGVLNNTIKREKPNTFKQTEASDLVIWHVSVLIDDDGEDEVTIANNFNSKRLLKSTGLLLNAFKDSVPKGTIHIIVERAK